MLLEITKNRNPEKQHFIKANDFKYTRAGQKRKTGSGYNNSTYPNSIIYISAQHSFASSCRVHDWALTNRNNTPGEHQNVQLFPQIDLVTVFSLQIITFKGNLKYYRATATFQVTSAIPYLLSMADSKMLGLQKRAQ